MSAQAQANFKSRKIKLSTQIKGRRAVRPNACNLISDLLLYIKGSVLEAGEKELSFSRLSCSALPSSFSQMCLIKNDLYRPTYSPFLLRWGGKTTLGAEWLDLWLFFFVPKLSLLWIVCWKRSPVPAGSALCLSSRWTDPMTSFNAVGLVGEL